MLQSQYFVRRQGKTLIASLGRSQGLELRLFDDFRSFMTFWWCPRDIEEVAQIDFNLHKWSRRDPDSRRFIRITGVGCVAQRDLTIVITRSNRKGWYSWKVFGNNRAAMLEMKIRQEETENIFSESLKFLKR